MEGSSERVAPLVFEGASNVTAGLCRASSFFATKMDARVTRAFGPSSAGYARASWCSISPSTTAAAHRTSEQPFSIFSKDLAERPARFFIDSTEGDSNREYYDACIPQEARHRRHVRAVHRGGLDGHFKFRRGPLGRRFQ